MTFLFGDAVLVRVLLVLFVFAACCSSPRTEALKVGEPVGPARAFACAANVGHFGFIFGGETAAGILDDFQVVDLHRMRWTPIRSSESAQHPPALRSCTLSALPPSHQVFNISWANDLTVHPLLPGVREAWPVTLAHPAAAQLVLLDERAARTNAAKFVTDTLALQSAEFPDERRIKDSWVWIFNTGDFTWTKQATAGTAPARLAHACVVFWSDTEGRYMIFVHGGKLYEKHC